MGLASSRCARGRPRAPAPPKIDQLQIQFRLTQPAHSTERSSDLRSAARLWANQASTMQTMLLNELLHSRRTPTPLRVLRTVVSGPRATRGLGRRHRRRDVPRPADRHGRELTSAMRLLGRFHDHRIGSVSWMGTARAAGAAGSCQIRARSSGWTTAADGGGRAQSTSHRPGSGQRGIIAGRTSSDASRRPAG
jgi:hypothetical protein